MGKIKITETEIPEQSVLKEKELSYDYVDSFQGGVIDKGQDLDVIDVGKYFFKSSPAWVEVLFALRNKIVGVFGLKTSGNEKQDSIDNFNGKPGERLGLFKVFDKTDNEIILGEDDKHLDFRISLFIDQEKDVVDQKNITISTTVKYNNWFGKLYFLPVKFFHKRIVPVMLKGIIRQIEKDRLCS